MFMSITEVVGKSRELGMSYGQYVAKYRPFEEIQVKNNFIRLLDDYDEDGNLIVRRKRGRPKKNNWW